MATEPVHIRIDEDVMKFIRKQAGETGHTQSGMINHFLRNEKNRTENKERKDNE